MSMAVLTFDPRGKGSCLYTEMIDLHAVGALEISRASTVEFNNARQKWEVKNLKGKVLFFSKFRAVCLEWEREHLAR